MNKGEGAVKCRHCKSARKIGKSPRGLCWKCLDNLAIRALYPLPEKRRVPVNDPTEAELDAMIAAQLPTMPGGVKGARKGAGKLAVPFSFKPRRK